jgi:alkylation response protein AidB-like acyl-CoA dehydrogenase
MEFGLSEEQVMLQDALARFLAGTGGLERTRAFAAGKDRRAPDVLQGLAELGVTGLIIPEVHGGVGLSLLDAALAAEQLGRFVAPAPFAATAVMATPSIETAVMSCDRLRQRKSRPMPVTVPPMVMVVLMTPPAVRSVNAVPA